MTDIHGVPASPVAAGASPPSVSIPNADERRLLVTTASVGGHLAAWAVRQSPYLAPDRLGEAVTQFRQLFPFEDAICIPDFPMNEWNGFGALYDAIWETIEKVPAILSWNEPKSQHGNTIGFASRYDKPSPDDDFIDLHALCRNVTRAAWQEALADAEQDEAWTAQGMEAASADETGTGSAEGDSPVAKPCAQGDPA